MLLPDLIRRYVRGGHALGRTLVLADIARAMRSEFLYAAVDSGLLDALRAPRTRAELISGLRALDTSLLDALLAQGVALRELRRSGERFALRGRRSRALIGPAGDPSAALLAEVATYHNSVYTQLADRIRGAPRGDYLEQTGELVARSSRIGEPLAGAFLAHALRRVRPKAVLDVGCGSGTYLRQAVRRRGATGVGVEMSEGAAEHARQNVRDWGLDDRIRIVCGDIREQSADLGGPFDLVLLFQNLYYFQPDEVAPLFAHLRSLVAPRGKLAIVCAFRGHGRLAAEIDVILRSTEGNAPLPDLDPTVAALTASGFDAGRPKRIVPFEPVYGILARAA